MKKIHKKAKKYPLCNTCKYTFHYNCSSVVSKTWSSLSSSVKASWNCIDCTRSIEKGKSSNKQKVNRRNSSSDSELEDNQPKRSIKTRRILANTSPSTSTPVSMVTLEQMKTVIHEALNTALQPMKEQLTSLTVMTKKFEYLEKSRDNAEQYSMKDEVIITNVPWQQGEKGCETVERIAKSLDLPLEVMDLRAFHWLPRRGESKQTAFLLKFIRFWQKNEFIANARKQRPTVRKFGLNSDDPVYINEHLNYATRKLLAKAKELQPFGYMKRTMDCKVFVRRNIPDARNIRITSEEQILSLIQETRAAGYRATDRDQSSTSDNTGQEKQNVSMPNY